jgi:hypothetical protein
MEASTLQEQRDFERAEEYSLIYSRGTMLGGNKFELSTGIILAARYADKLRRVALVTLSKLVPKEVIIRDVAELNKQLYHLLVEEMKLGKLDVIRIQVDAEYDQNSKKIIWGQPKVTRYLTAKQCESMNEAIKRENEELKKELTEIKLRLEKLLRE